MEEREIELASGMTLVRSEGRGRPLVWTHGFLNSIAAEDAIGLSALLRALPGVEVVRYDARGHGRSAPARDDAAQSWPSLGGDLLELVTELRLERPIAAGASMGTATSLHAAVRNPGALCALILVVPPTAWDTRKAQADLYRAGAALVEARGAAAYLDAMRAAFRAQPMPGFTQEMQEALIAELASKSGPDLARLLRGAAASDLPDPARIRELELPALVIATRGDPGHPLSTAEKLTELLPRAELLVLDDLRQLAHARGDIVRFLSRTGPRAASAAEIDVYDPDR